MPEFTKLYEENVSETTFIKDLKNILGNCAPINSVVIIWDATRNTKTLVYNLNDVVVAVDK